MLKTLADRILEEVCYSFEMEDTARLLQRHFRSGTVSSLPTAVAATGQYCIAWCCIMLQ